MDFLASVSGFAACLLAIIYFLILSKEKGWMGISIETGGWRLLVVGVGVLATTLVILLFSLVIVPYLLM
ncbi:hypothetical protein [Microbulbifer sp. JMSA002]|uniref:hypothetical protein n=1 Tax=Microbulbifer sp. JMSA002 TaxID=3243368 RepID=UPI0040396419